MYFSPREVAETRHHTLHNFLAASTAWIAAGERLASLFLRAGREAFVHGSRHIDGLAGLPSPPHLPVWSWSAGLQHTPARLMEEAFDILGDAHTALIQATEAQIRLMDHLLFAVIDRTRKSSPWEGEIALAVMRNTLQGAENTLHDMADAAIQTVEQTEIQLKQVAETLGETGAPVAAPPAARRTKSA